MTQATNNQPSTISTNNGIEILCIGSELLLGKILNTNVTWLADQLALIGLNHYFQSVVGDNSERLKSCLIDSSKRSRILITTGGLGPTPDDLTIETIASTFKTKLIENQEIINDIKSKFRFSVEIPKNNFKQALLPENSKLIPNFTGTAPGIIYSPSKDFTIITLPGVPSEMKHMWKQTVRDWLSDHFSREEVIYSKTLKFTGISESSLAEKIPKLLQNKNPTVAPYASLGEVKLRITANAKTAKKASSLIQPIETKLKNTFELNYYGSENETLASIVIDLLRKRKEKLSVAESCTGGSLSAALTEIPCASDAFVGGVVAYNNYIKQNILGVPNNLLEKHGAVSEQVAKAMAIGIKNTFRTDWSIAISGIAGPSGGSSLKPVGLVEIVIFGQTSYQSIQEHFGSHRERNQIQKLSVVRALDQLRLFLLEKS